MMNKSSIAAKLFLMILSAYLLVTIIISAIQAGYSYSQSKKYLLQEISSVAVSFEEPLAEAIWGYEKNRIVTIINGMMKSPMILSVKIYDEHGGLIAGSGETSANLNISYEKDIYYSDFDENRFVGRIEVCSSKTEIFKRLSGDIKLILFAALLKTSVLFFLFFWVLRRFLLAHLENFIRQIKELNTEKLDNAEIKLNIKDRNELSQLEMAFNQLIRKLAVSRSEMEHINQNLDNMVKERTRQLEILSTTDELTGLYNRRHFKDIAARELNRCRREKKSFTFAMLDIDDFKRYNDCYGHLQGDTALKAVANALTESVTRGNDFVFRMGGEEFSIITSGMDKDDAFRLMENLRLNVQNLGIEHKNSRVSGVITISIGILHVSGEKGCNINTIYKGADHALYTAKEKGRNRVELLHCEDHNKSDALCKNLPNV